jgi:hypothetical protein
MGIMVGPGRARKGGGGGDSTFRTKKGHGGRGHCIGIKKNWQRRND